MYQALLAYATLPLFLLKIDSDFAEEARAGGCLFCGGSLHSARFPRKVRGGWWHLGEEHDWRYSFCCSQEGCRRRLTPPSVRFIGHGVYLSVVVVLAGLLLQGPTPWRIAHLSEKLGVSRRTLVRWRKWWQEEFSKTKTWRKLRGRLAGLNPDEPMPAAILDRFNGKSAEEKFIALMKLLAKLSASIAISEGCLSPAELAR